MTRPILLIGALLAATLARSAAGADDPAFTSRERLIWPQVLGRGAPLADAPIRIPVNLVFPDDLPASGLVEALLDWRRAEMAKGAHPPPPFPSVLRRIAAARPVNDDGLRAVEGMRDTVAETHGPAILDQVARFGPSGETGTRHPVVVLLHGSGGVTSALEDRYASALADIGVAAAIPDSFTPRGVSSTGRRQGAVTAVDMLGDAYALLDHLADHPRVDPERIGLVGFSKGGAVALLATDERVRSALAGSDARFALHVAFYPYCGHHLQRFQPTGAPVLLLLGEKDSYTPAALCNRYVHEATEAGANVTRIVYPDAHHAWDAPYAVRRSDFDYSYGGCEVEIDVTGAVTETRTGIALDSVEAGRAFIRRCATPGVWLGRNDEARERSLSDLVDFVRRRLAR